MEGVVGKWGQGIYQTDGRAISWVEVKNPTYSQAEGRAELFEHGRGRRPKAAALILR